LGKIWAIVEGKVVVEGEYLPRLGELVYNSRMREVGIVSSVLGKAECFFIEINPKGNAKLREDEHLYILEEKESNI